MGHGCLLPQFVGGFEAGTGETVWLGADAFNGLLEFGGDFRCPCAGVGDPCGPFVPGDELQAGVGETCMFDAGLVVEAVALCGEAVDDVFKDAASIDVGEGAFAWHFEGDEDGVGTGAGIGNHVSEYDPVMGEGAEAEAVPAPVLWDLGEGFRGHVCGTGDAELFVEVVGDDVVFDGDAGGIESGDADAVAHKDGVADEEGTAFGFDADAGPEVVDGDEAVDEDVDVVGIEPGAAGVVVHGLMVDEVKAVHAGEFEAAGSPAGCAETSTAPVVAVGLAVDDFHIDGTAADAHGAVVVGEEANEGEVLDFVAAKGHEGDAGAVVPGEGDIFKEEIAAAEDVDGGVVKQFRSGVPDGEAADTHVMTVDHADHFGMSAAEGGGADRDFHEVAGVGVVFGVEKDHGLIFVDEVRAGCELVEIEDLMLGDAIDEEEFAAEAGGFDGHQAGPGIFFPSEAVGPGLLEDVGVAGYGLPVGKNIGAGEDGTLRLNKEGAGFRRVDEFEGFPVDAGVNVEGDACAGGGEDPGLVEGVLNGAEGGGFGAVAIGGSTGVRMQMAHGVGGGKVPDF